jgi:hypothetical protein
MWNFSFLIISAVPKCMSHDVVIINGITLLMYIMSILSVTFLCHCSSSSGRSSNAFMCTFDGVFLVVFPFSDPKLGPSISSACNMSDLLIGQFRSKLPSMYLMKSLVDGRPMMSCMDWDLQSLEYSLTVYLFLILSTVLMRTMSLLTSEKNSSFLEGLNA